jgi:hypothetical protein
MNYDYLICGCHIRFEIPWELKMTAESLPFLLETPCLQKPALTIQFAETEQLPPVMAGGVWHSDAYYLTREGKQYIWHCPTRNDPPYCCVVWGKDAATCYCAKEQKNQIIYTKNLLELMGLEQFLIQFDGILLHAALISWAGKGILFCAPSGTGKSTQADLWEKHMASRTLNGDRAGIRQENGIWKAWGLPFAGTSGIYCNQSVPIRAVALLHQAAENRLTPLTPVEAFKGLLPQCNARRWDGAFMERLTDRLSSFVGAVPFYRLDCRPDTAAVELLRDAILKEN